MGRGVLALLFFLLREQFFLLILLALVNSTFCQTCLSLFIVLFVGFACFGATPHICYQTGRQPWLFVGGRQPTPICYWGPQATYLLLYLLYHSSFCWICLVVFTVLFVGIAYSCSQFFLLILIPLFTVLFVGFAWLCSQFFLRVFFVTPHNKKKSGFGRSSVQFYCAGILIFWQLFLFFFLLILVISHSL